MRGGLRPATVAEGGSRLSARHNGRVLPRPPLPPGPFLVVGLARSGVAAALALRSLGAEVVGCDSGPVSDARRAELAGAGVPVHAGVSGTELIGPAGTIVERAPASRARPR